MLHSFHKLQRLLQQNVVSTPDQRPLHPNGISLDVHLGASLYVEDTSQMRIIDLAKREPFAYKPITLTPDEPCFILSPGATVIACTEEVFSLPDDCAAMYILTSSLARRHLNQNQSCLGHPGWSNSVFVLELTNVSRVHYLKLTVGMVIGQVIFMPCSPVPPQHLYSAVGRYNNDRFQNGVHA